MTIREILKSTFLSPLDTEILLSLAISKSREYLFAHPEKKLSPVQIKKFKKLAAKRMKKEPIAYITGKKEFFGLEFDVDKNVLIPRPETELLVELALNILQKNTHDTPTAVIDVGTGSGNIIISIARNIPAKARKVIDFYASDISKKALDIAKKNAKKHKISQDIKFVKSDLLQFVVEKKIRGNILIIANLPYLSDFVYRQNEENLKHEPKIALVSKYHGLNHYARLFSQARRLLKGYARCVACYAEISPEQKNMLERIAQKELKPEKIKFAKDLFGKTRIAQIESLSPGKLTNIHKN